jgi:hypothetical protein
MSMKNTNDTIGNRTRDLPTCSAVPQPTALPRAPAAIVVVVVVVVIKIIIIYVLAMKAYVGAEVYLHPVLNSALDGG